MAWLVPICAGSNANADGPHEVRVTIGMQHWPVTAGPPSRPRHSAGTTDIQPDTYPVLVASHTLDQPLKLGAFSCSERE